MGINQFSIYSSFKNKEGVLSACITRYQDDVLLRLINKAESKNLSGIDKLLFFIESFIDETKITGEARGCFVNNMVDEFSRINSEVINKKVIKFTELIKDFIKRQLDLDNNWDEKEKEKIVVFLLINFQGLLRGTKMFNTDVIKEQIGFILNKI